MSAINGDKARFNRQRRQKIARRSGIENLSKESPKDRKPLAQPDPQIRRNDRQ